MGSGINARTLDCFPAYLHQMIPSYLYEFPEVEDHLGIKIGSLKNSSSSLYLVPNDEMSICVIDKCRELDETLSIPDKARNEESAVSIIKGRSMIPLPPSFPSFQ